jgi:hypothetical protein
LLTITRLLARQLRAVFRRAGIGRAYGGYGQRALLLADQDTLRIRGMSGCAAVEYQAAPQGGPIQALLPLDLLVACEGSKPDPVQLDFSVSGKVSASWTDKQVPIVLEFDAEAPTDKTPTFPPLPSAFATNEPDLWPALREAAATTDSSSVRYALGCIQLRGSEGQVVATDGHQALVQSGFTFPWTEEILVPASNIFGCRELPTDQPIYVGKTEDWMTFRIGPWSINLEVNKNGRFPDVQRHLADPQSATSRLCLEEADSRFLAEAWPRLPCGDENNYPITLDLNGQVLIRGRGSDQSRATELILSNSRLEGESIVINSNRKYFERAARLGFRDVHLFGNEAALLCCDARRNFVWMPLEAKDTIASGKDPIRIESSGSTGDCAPAAPKPKRSKPVMSEPTVQPQPAPTGEKPAAKAKRTKITPAKTTPIEQAIALRDGLRTAVVQANELIHSLKRQKREARLVQSTLDSLKQLQNVGA